MVVEDADEGGLSEEEVVELLRELLSPNASQSPGEHKSADDGRNSCGLGRSGEGDSVVEGCCEGGRRPRWWREVEKAGWATLSTSSSTRDSTTPRCSTSRSTMLP